MLKFFCISLDLLISRNMGRDNVRIPLVYKRVQWRELAYFKNCYTYFGKAAKKKTSIGFAPADTSRLVSIDNFYQSTLNRLAATYAMMCGVVVTIRLFFRSGENNLVVIILFPICP